MFKKQYLTLYLFFGVHTNAKLIKYYLRNAPTKICSGEKQQKRMEKSMKNTDKRKRSTIKKAVKNCAVYVAAIYIAVVCAATRAIPDKFTYFGESYSPVWGVAEQVEAGSYTAKAKLFGAIPIKNVSVDVVHDLKLCPVGDVFGIKFFTKGVIVIGTTEIECAEGFISPAEKAGIHKNDIITKVNGAEVNTVEALAEIVEECSGKPLFIQYTRNGKEYECELNPVMSVSDKKYKTGIWVRDSTAGIGTVTCYNPENGYFMGLGHGICDIDTGELMPLLRGTVVDVDITEVVPGKPGQPGELKGVFSYEKQGALAGNTSAGVYGMLDKAPYGLTAPLPVASRSEVKEGEASIRSNPDGKGIREYSVTLSKMDRRSEGTKCFVVEITDPALLSLTGGIVQGMSGSPIIQNGKLIGAVTHVFVNDPTKGYGIFIENMLEAAS